MTIAKPRHLLDGSHRRMFIGGAWVEAASEGLLNYYLAHRIGYAYTRK